MRSAKSLAHGLQEIEVLLRSTAKNAPCRYGRAKSWNAVGGEVMGEVERFVNVAV